jgi:Family of unknown function (DUF6519)
MGNFTKSPKDGLSDSLSQGHIGVHFEQGTLLLDRDLNLAGDLIGEASRRVFTACLGDGPAPGGGGFGIKAVESSGPFYPFNDFIISAGSYLSSGRLVTNAADVFYSAQTSFTPDPLTAPDPAETDESRIDTVYLDVWLQERDSTTDSALRNEEDVNVETSVRESIVWAVRVREGGGGYLPAKDSDMSDGHHYTVLATLSRLPQLPEALDIRASQITDLRPPRRASLTDLVQRIEVLEKVLQPRIHLISSSSTLVSPYPENFEESIVTRTVVPGAHVVISGAYLSSGNPVVTLDGNPVEFRAVQGDYSSGPWSDKLYLTLPGGQGAQKLGVSTLEVRTDQGSTEALVLTTYTNLSFYKYGNGGTRQMPWTGLAALDIAACGTSVWLINAGGGSQHQIMRRGQSQGGFLPVGDPIDAVRIAVGLDDVPWIVTSNARIYRLEGSRWVLVPGSATDLAIGADGSIWKVGAVSVPGGYDIARWDGRRWNVLPGAGGVRIGVEPSGAPVLVNDAHHAVIFDGAEWRVDTTATMAGDIAAGANGSIFHGAFSTIGYYLVSLNRRSASVYWESQWTAVSGSSASHSMGIMGLCVDGNGNPWAVDNDKNVYQLYAWPS